MSERDRCKGACTKHAENAESGGANGENALVAPARAEVECEDEETGGMSETGAQRKAYERRAGVEEALRLTPTLSLVAGCS